MMATPQVHAAQLVSLMSLMSLFWNSRRKCRMTAVAKSLSAGVDVEAHVQLLHRSCWGCLWRWWDAAAADLKSPKSMFSLLHCNRNMLLQLQVKAAAADEQSPNAARAADCSRQRKTRVARAESCLASVRKHWLYTKQRERRKAATNASIKVLKRAKLQKHENEKRVEAAAMREPESKVPQLERKARERVAVNEMREPDNI